MSKRTAVVLAFAGFATATVIALVVWMLFRGDATATPLASAPSETATASGSATPQARARDGLSDAGDPDTYAREIAAVVFAVDTRTGSPNDLRARLLAEADPRLSETGRADLERLLVTRIPTDEGWARMASNEQWSEWVTTGTHEPGTFAQMVIEGQTYPGWAMRNVTGIQTTHYRDGGAWREAARERTVTVAMRCPLPGADAVDLDRCRLLLVPATVVP
jgi:hypothetical protein